MPIDRFICLATGGGIMLALLFVGSHPVPQGWDKLAHFACFSVITALLWRGTCGRAPLAVLACVVTFAALDELHQMFLPTRSAEWLDVDTEAAPAGSAFRGRFLIAKSLFDGLFRP